MLKHRSARDLKDLIQDILKNPEFSIDEVDSNMHERLLRSIGDGETEVLDMWQGGDGEHDVRFFKRKVETVLRELLFDERLEGWPGVPVLWLQNSQGERILRGHVNGSGMFQVAQEKVVRVEFRKGPHSILHKVRKKFLVFGWPWTEDFSTQIRMLLAENG